MDEPGFDDLNQTLEASTPRRRAVQRLSMAGAGLLAVVGIGNAAARDNKHPQPRPNNPDANAAKGKRGPAGPRGPVGPTGPAGSVAPLITYNEVSFSIPASTPTSIALSCPDNGLAVGGGVTLTNSKCWITASSLFLPDSWIAAGRCPAGETSNNNPVKVICLN